MRRSEGQKVLPQIGCKQTNKKNSPHAGAVISNWDSNPINVQLQDFPKIHLNIVSTLQTAVLYFYTFLIKTLFPSIFFIFSILFGGIG